MKILITGGCGFVGSNLAIYLKKKLKKAKISTLDNLSRKGSKINRVRLKSYKIENLKIDISDFKKIKKLPKYNLVIDCCAEAAIEASKLDPDRVISTNLIGTYNILKKCVKDKSKIIFLSSSRVYSIRALRKLIGKINLKSKIKKKYKINEKFNIFGPKSLYGLSKLSSEELIREFNYANNINYIINRLGVISGPWQFGKQDQGFVSPVDRQTI
jgi:Nucleoside-diphosphate-sugar epimerases